MIKKEIDIFVERLSNYCGKNVYNQYSDNEKGELRKENLKLFLSNILIKKPKYICVGEAAGYKGCRLTGVPFTSEFVMKNNKFWLINFKNQTFSSTSNEGIQKESTATVVWQALEKINEIPLLWNIFPFHPHKTENPESNRRPNNNEIEEGKRYLNELSEIFNNPILIPIGKSASKGLAGFSKVGCLIRHPANGGKKDFTKGIINLIARGNV